MSWPSTVKSVLLGLVMEMILEALLKLPAFLRGEPVQLGIDKYFVFGPLPYRFRLGCELAPVHGDTGAAARLMANG